MLFEESDEVFSHGGDGLFQGLNGLEAMVIFCVVITGSFPGPCSFSVTIVIGKWRNVCDEDRSVSISRFYHPHFGCPF